MRDWLSYLGAFACGMAVAIGGYVMAFSFVMTSSVGFSVAGFVGLVILLPVMAGGFVFGIVYSLAAGVTFSGSDWLNGAAFTLGITIVCTSLLLSQAMGELLAGVLLAGLLFAGGRVLLTRKTDV